MHNFYKRFLSATIGYVGTSNFRCACHWISNGNTQIIHTGRWGQGTAKRCALRLTARS